MWYTQSNVLYSCTYIHLVQKNSMFTYNLICKYSETLPYGHPWKVAIYNIADTSFGPKYIHVCLSTIKTSEMWKPLHSVKQTGFSVPTVPELYKWHLSTAFVKLHTSSGRFKGWALYLPIMLTFLKNVRQWKVPKMQLHTPHQHEHTLPHQPKTPKIQIPPYYRHTAMHCPNGASVCFWGAPL